MSGADLAAVVAMLAGVGFAAVVLTELSDRLRRRIVGRVER